MMMRRAKGNRKGVAMIEFTFVGIPMIFVLVSSFEMARGMWIYHTMAYAVKEGARYARNFAYLPEKPCQRREMAGGSRDMRGKEIRRADFAPA